MDLLDRGRTLRELGATLTWWDIKTLLIHLPPDSHTMRLLHPDVYRQWDILKTENQITAAIRDAILTTAGIPVGDAEAVKPLLTSLLAGKASTKSRESDTLPRGASTVTASEARARIVAATDQ